MHKAESKEVAIQKYLIPEAISQELQKSARIKKIVFMVAPYFFNLIENRIMSIAR